VIATGFLLSHPRGAVQAGARVRPTAGRRISGHHSAQKFESCRQCQHAASNPARIFAVSATGCTIRRGFRNSRNFRTPITNRATPKFVVHGERPTTDFLGTSAGPMGVCRDASSSLVAACLHHRGRAAVAVRETGAVGALVMRLFGAVRTNRSQPRIMRVVLPPRRWRAKTAPSCCASVRPGGLLGGMDEAPSAGEARARHELVHHRPHDRAGAAHRDAQGDRSCGEGVGRASFQTGMGCSPES
jgi:hypothetical protein